MKNKKMGILIVALLVILIIAVIVATIVITSNKGEKSSASTNVQANSESSNATTNTQTSNDKQVENTVQNTTTGATTKENTTTTTSTTTKENTTTTNASVTETANKDVTTDSKSTDDSKEKVTLYIGTTNNFKTYETEIYANLSVEEKAQLIINEIGAKLGYQVMIKEIYSGKGGMSIDFDKDSAPFDLKTTYRGNGEEEHKVSGDTNVINTIFDSIKETLQKYFGKTMDVYFQKDGKDIEIDSVTPAIKINSQEPYKGSGN